MAVLAACLALWQLIVSVRHINPQLLPGPDLIVHSTWNDRVDLWPAIGVTTEEAVLGLLLAIVVAFIVAVAIDSFRPVRGSLYPLIVASQTVPIIALAPLVLVWWGFGLLPKVVLVALFSFFPIIGRTGPGSGVDRPRRHQPPAHHARHPAPTADRGSGCRARCRSSSPG